MESYCRKWQGASTETFLASFPFNEYLQTVSFTDFSTIQSHRYLVWSLFADHNSVHDGDAFLYSLANFFLNKYPITLGNLSSNISIGEFYLDGDKVLSNLYQPHLDENEIYKANTNETYVTIGYYILGRVAEKMRYEAINKNLNLNDSINASYVSRLQANKIFVSIEESSSAKLAAHIRKGDFSYIWSRVKATAQPYIGSGAGYYISWAVLIILLLSLVSNLNGFVKFFFFCFVILLAILKISIGLAPSSSDADRPSIEQQEYKRMYPSGNGDHLVDVYSLRSGNNLIGYSVWLRRPDVKATYFALSANVQYNNFKGSNSVVLATSGGYTTNLTEQIVRPDGFTVEGGKLSNAVILHDRQGLVMFSNGSIRMFNLKDSIRLPSGERLESPLKNIMTYSRLLQWCKENSATVFQTHLLAFSDSVMITDKAKKEARERRILALFSKPGSEEIFHAIFDLRQPLDLYTAATEIFKIISSRGYRVEGIANLDTGNYNILNVFDESGALIQDLNGPVDANTATNLIVYYR